MLIGNVPGSSPKKLPMRTTTGFFGFLDVRDIPGTATGTRGKGNFHTVERRDQRKVNETEDISGA